MDFQRRCVNKLKLAKVLLFSYLFELVSSNVPYIRMKNPTVGTLPRYMIDKAHSLNAQATKS